jgi:dephospho-CoA kinase
VYRRITAWFANQPHVTRLAVADIPLLFETGHEHDFELVIVVACDADEQIRRLMARDRLTHAEARARIAAQWPIEEKARRADYVIRTDGSFAETDAHVRAIFVRLA